MPKLKLMLVVGEAEAIEALGAAPVHFKTFVDAVPESAIERLALLDRLTNAIADAQREPKGRWKPLARRTAPAEAPSEPEVPPNKSPIGAP